LLAPTEFLSDRRCAELVEEAGFPERLLSNSTP